MSSTDNKAREILIDMHGIADPNLGADLAILLAGLDGTNGWAQKRRELLKGNNEIRNTAQLLAESLEEYVQRLKEIGDKAEKAGFAHYEERKARRGF